MPSGMVCFGSPDRIHRLGKLTLRDDSVSSLRPSTQQVSELLRRTRRPVYAINPLSVARYRERHSVARTKSDRVHAQLLATILRTDRAAIGPCQPIRISHKRSPGWMDRLACRASSTHFGRSVRRRARAGEPPNVGPR
jgi:Transposase